MRSVMDDVQANELAYERLAPELEQSHPGEWVVILNGQVVVVASSREEALRRAGPASPDSPSRLVRSIGEELPKVVRRL
jgi:hypothetical protein